MMCKELLFHEASAEEVVVLVIVMIIVLAISGIAAMKR